MRLIEIKALNNGAHRNQASEAVEIPSGWAIIPDDLDTPNFPFGSVVAKEISGVMTVTAWVPGAVPDPEPEPDPTIEDISLDLLADHEERICLLELTSAT